MKLFTLWGTLGKTSVLKTLDLGMALGLQQKSQEKTPQCRHFSNAGRQVMREMKAYRTYREARKAAAQHPIVRVGDIYIVGAKLENLGLDEISLIDGGGNLVANVILKHFNRLGNANWAEPAVNSPCKPTKQIWNGGKW
jgi:hypothetical protein